MGKGSKKRMKKASRRAPHGDPDTQRRSDNVDKIQILPVSEALPGMHPQGIAGMEKDLQTLISRQRRRKRCGPACRQRRAGR